MKMLSKLSLVALALAAFVSLTASGGALAKGQPEPGDQRQEDAGNP